MYIVNMRRSPFGTGRVETYRREGKRENRPDDADCLIGTAGRGLFRGTAPWAFEILRCDVFPTGAISKDRGIRQ